MNDVIVADDNPVVVSMLSEIFKKSGYTVRTASDGFAALASIRERVPDILISDLNCAEMWGHLPFCTTPPLLHIIVL
jgi:CheY-like chemotaxis protein